MKKQSILFKTICSLLIILFSNSMISPLAKAAYLNLPSPSQMIPLSRVYSFPVLKGVRLDFDNPLNIEFIIDAGSKDEVTEEDASRLIKYFLAGLTIPEENLWVNLSPYEKDRVIPEKLAETDLGKDLLSQDYILKQLLSSITHPESKTGKDYWQKTYKQIAKIAKTANIPVDTFNKIWIMPESARVYENENVALITEANLKAMLQEDYELLAANSTPQALNQEKTKTINKTASEVMRQVILPKINKDVNVGENFSTLRQIYHSIILAEWFKQKFKDSFYRSYLNKEKIKGIDLDDKKIKEKVYSLYTEAFQKGLYDYIKTEKEPQTDKTIKRRYFSGGVLASSVQAGVFQTHKSLINLQALGNIKEWGVSSSIIPMPNNADPFKPKAEKSESKDDLIKIDWMNDLTPGTTKWPDNSTGIKMSRDEKDGISITVYSEKETHVLSAERNGYVAVTELNNLKAPINIYHLNQRPKHWAFTTLLNRKNQEIIVRMVPEMWAKIKDKFPKQITSTSGYKVVVDTENFLDVNGELLGDLGNAVEGFKGGSKVDYASKNILDGKEKIIISEVLYDGENYQENPFYEISPTGSVICVNGIEGADTRHSYILHNNSKDSWACYNPFTSQDIFHIRYLSGNHTFILTKDGSSRDNFRFKVRKVLSSPATLDVSKNKSDVLDENTNLILSIDASRKTLTRNPENLHKLSEEFLKGNGKILVNEWFYGKGKPYEITRHEITFKNDKLLIKNVDTDPVGRHLEKIEENHWGYRNPYLGQMFYLTYDPENKTILFKKDPYADYGHRFKIREVLSSPVNFESTTVFIDKENAQLLDTLEIGKFSKRDSSIPIPDSVANDDARIAVYETFKEGDIKEKLCFTFMHNGGNLLFTGPDVRLITDTYWKYEPKGESYRNIDIFYITSLSDQDQLVLNIPESGLTATPAATYEIRLEPMADKIEKYPGYKEIAWEDIKKSPHGVMWLADNNNVRTIKVTNDGNKKKLEIWEKNDVNKTYILITDAQSKYARTFNPKSSRYVNNEIILSKKLDIPFKVYENKKQNKIIVEILSSEIWTKIDIEEAFPKTITAYNDYEITLMPSSPIKALFIGSSPHEKINEALLGHSLKIVPNGGKALEELKNDDYNLVIIDKDAYQVLWRNTIEGLKTQYPELPMILVSSRIEMDVALFCKQFNNITTYSINSIFGDNLLKKIQEITPQPTKKPSSAKAKLSSSIKTRKIYSNEEIQEKLPPLNKFTAALNAVKKEKKLSFGFDEEDSISGSFLYKDGFYWAQSVKSGKEDYTAWLLPNVDFPKLFKEVETIYPFLQNNNPSGNALAQLWQNTKKQLTAEKEPVLSSSINKDIKILLVESNEINLKDEKNMLKKSGYSNVDTAASAEQAFKKFKQGNYDLIISNYKLQGMGGVALLSKINETEPSFPFILNTYHISDETTRELFRIYPQLEIIDKSDFADQIEETIPSAMPRQALSSSIEKYPGFKELDWKFRIGWKGQYIGEGKSVLVTIPYQNSINVEVDSKEGKYELFFDSGSHEMHTNNPEPHDNIMWDLDITKKYTLPCYCNIYTNEDQSRLIIDIPADIWENRLKGHFPKEITALNGCKIVVRPLKVLIAYKEQPLRETLTTTMQIAGNVPESADNWEKAVQMIYKNNYDLIIVEATLLQEKTNLDNELNRINQNTPVILTVGSATPEERQDLQEDYPNVRLLELLDINNEIKTGIIEEMTEDISSGRIRTHSYSDIIKIRSLLKGFAEGFNVVNNLLSFKLAKKGQPPQRQGFTISSNTDTFQDGESSYLAKRISFNLLPNFDFSALTKLMETTFSGLTDGSLGEKSRQWQKIKEIALSERISLEDIETLQAEVFSSPAKKPEKMLVAVSEERLIKQSSQIKTILETQGYEADTTTDMEKAMQKFEEGDIQGIIIIDSDLGGSAEELNIRYYYYKEDEKSSLKIIKMGSPNFHETLKKAVLDSIDSLASSSIKQPKILIAFGAENISKGLKEDLLLSGYSVEAAQNWEEAVKKNQNKEYDLIIAEHLLIVGKDTFTNGLKKIGKDTPIVVTTVYETGPEVSQLYRKDGYNIKFILQSGLVPELRNGLVEKLTTNPQASSSLKILYIDNYPDRDIINNLPNHDLTIAENTGEGAKKNEAAPYDLIIIEKRTAGYDWGDLFGRLRADNQKLPIILFGDYFSASETAICNIYNITFLEKNNPDYILANQIKRTASRLASSSSIKKYPGYKKVPWESIDELNGKYFFNELVRIVQSKMPEGKDIILDIFSKEKKPYHQYRLRVSQYGDGGIKLYDEHNPPSKKMTPLKLPGKINQWMFEIYINEESQEMIVEMIPELFKGLKAAYEKSGDVFPEEIVSDGYKITIKKQPEILVAFKYDGIADPLKKVLLSAGYLVQTAQSREEADNLLKKNKYDLVIVESLLITDNSYLIEGLEKIGKDTPIIVTTASETDSETSKKYKKEGYNIKFIRQLDLTEQLRKGLIEKLTTKPKTSSSLKILRIDNNPVEVILADLTMHHNLSTVASAESALNRLKEKSYDLILVRKSTVEKDWDYLFQQLTTNNPELPIILYAESLTKKQKTFCADHKVTSLLKEGSSNSYLADQIIQAVSKFASSSSIEKKQPKILIAYSDKNVLEGLPRNPSLSGYSVKTVQSWEDAVDIFQKDGSYDLIIAEEDLLLKKGTLDGNLNKIKNTKDIPIVLITTMDSTNSEYSQRLKKPSNVESVQWTRFFRALEQGLIEKLTAAKSSSSIKISQGYKKINWRDVNGPEGKPFLNGNVKIKRNKTKNGNEIVLEILNIKGTTRCSLSVEQFGGGLICLKYYDPAEEKIIANLPSKIGSWMFEVYLNEEKDELIAEMIPELWKEIKKKLPKQIVFDRDGTFRVETSSPVLDDPDEIYEELLQLSPDDRVTMIVEMKDGRGEIVEIELNNQVVIDNDFSDAEITVSDEKHDSNPYTCSYENVIELEVLSSPIKMLQFPSAPLKNYSNNDFLKIFYMLRDFADGFVYNSNTLEFKFIDRSQANQNGYTFTRDWDRTSSVPYVFGITPGLNFSKISENIESIFNILKENGSASDPFLNEKIQLWKKIKDIIKNNQFEKINSKQILSLSYKPGDRENIIRIPLNNDEKIRNGKKSIIIHQTAPKFSEIAEISLTSSKRMNIFYQEGGYTFKTINKKSFKCGNLYRANFNMEIEGGELIIKVNPQNIMGHPGQTYTYDIIGMDKVSSSSISNPSEAELSKLKREDTVNMVVKIPNYYKQYGENTYLSLDDYIVIKNDKSGKEITVSPRSLGLFPMNPNTYRYDQVEELKLLSASSSIKKPKKILVAVSQNNTELILKIGAILNTRGYIAESTFDISEALEKFKKGDINNLMVVDLDDELTIRYFDKEKDDSSWIRQKINNPNLLNQILTSKVLQAIDAVSSSSIANPSEEELKKLKREDTVNMVVEIPDSYKKYGDDTLYVSCYDYIIIENDDTRKTITMGPSSLGLFPMNPNTYRYDQVRELEVLSSSIKVLLVDDSPTDITTTRKLLREKGYDVETAYDGEEALKKFKQGKYDIIISDALMPEMNGIQLLSAIKEEAPEFPFILATSYMDENTEEDLLSDYKKLEIIRKINIRSQLEGKITSVMSQSPSSSSINGGISLKEKGLKTEYGSRSSYFKNLEIGEFDGASFKIHAIKKGSLVKELLASAR